MKRLAVNTAILALLLGLISNPALATPVPVTTATASSYYEGMLPAKTIDGSGLIGTFPNQTHNTEYLDMWMTQQGDVQNAWIQFDLGAVYNLAGAHIWNYNQYTEIDDDPNSPYDLTNRGIQQVDIFVSLDSTSWTVFANDVIFPQAPSPPGSDYAGFDLPFGGTLARYVKFEIESNYGIDPGANPGSGNYVGLSEVQFTSAAVPEPATMLLLGSGLIGMGAFVRRKFKK